MSDTFSTMTYFDYLAECDKVQREHPEWRWGQTLFNIAFQIRPHITARAQNIGIDPFYTNGVDARGRWIIQQFLDHLHRYWDE